MQGGQILRISISLSAILGVPVRVTKIRAGRSKPGLAAQHLKGIASILIKLLKHHEHVPLNYPKSMYLNPSLRKVPDKHHTWNN